jgi:RHS repeat-associated protein
VFGQATITTPTATDDKPTIESSLRFPGQTEDAETGLYYNWHRYYDPALGRYVTADPIGLVGGVNLYAYVNGDPVNLSDPTGEIIPQVIGAVIGAGLEYLTNPCAKPSDIIIAGVIGALGGGVSKNVFLRYGPRSLTRETGKEWSHSISKKTVDKYTSGWLRKVLNRRGGLNGSWTSPERHYKHDANRFPKGWKDFGDRYSLPRSIYDRTPDWFKGSAASGGAGAGIAGSDCECQ